jgi:hypothetical protein
VTLIAPDGTQVVLHDHQAGTTPEDTTDYGLGSSGIFAYYPDDLEPAQSLNALIGHQAAGTWALEVLDDDTSGTPGMAPRLIGWGLQVGATGAITPLSEPAFAVPVAAHAAGSNNTFWVTDLRVLNTAVATEASIRLFLVPSGADGSADFRFATLTVPYRTVLDLRDVIALKFGTGDIQGNLLFETDSQELHVTSRTYNTGGASGTYGQFIGMAGAADTIGLGDPPQLLLHLADNADYRANLGLSEMAGSQATVTVTARDGATGEVLGSAGQFTVQPFSNTQVNRILDTLGVAPADNAFAEVEVTGGSGRVTSYASMVDNQTGDAIFVPGRHPAQASSFVVPIVAKVAGEEGTNWVTDVRAYNAASSALELTFEYRPQLGSGGSTLTASATIPAGQVLASDDVLATLFGLDNASGSLRLVAAGQASMVVSSRTYNQTDKGTYGQFIPAVSSGFQQFDRVVLIHLDSSSAFRANLGICEVAGGTVDLRYVLKSDIGVTLATGTLSLEAFQVEQINDIYDSLGVAPRDNTRVEFFMDGGDGAYVAYASIVDNLSGDAIYVPAMSY